MVPGLFGDVNCHQYGVNGSLDLLNPLCKGFHGTDAELLELQDAMLVAKLRGYMAWIDRVIYIIYILHLVESDR